MTIAMLEGAFTLELFRFAARKPLPKYRARLESDLRTLGVKHFLHRGPPYQGRLPRAHAGRRAFRLGAGDF